MLRIDTLNPVSLFHDIITVIDLDDMIGEMHSLEDIYVFLMDNRNSFENILHIDLSKITCSGNTVCKRYVIDGIECYSSINKCGLFIDDSTYMRLDISGNYLTYTDGLITSARGLGVPHKRHGFDSIFVNIGSSHSVEITRDMFVHRKNARKNFLRELVLEGDYVKS